MLTVWLKWTALAVTLLLLVAVLAVLLLAALNVIELPHFYSHKWNEG